MPAKNVAKSAAVTEKRAEGSLEDLNRLLGPDPEKQPTHHLRSNEEAAKPPHPVTPANLAKYRQRVIADPVLERTRHEVFKYGAEEATYLTFRDDLNADTFSKSVTLPGSITDQERTGRCWMFANLNMFRSWIMRELNLKDSDDLKLDVNYLYFFDKLERAGFWINSLIDTAGERVDSKAARKVFKEPIPAFDGGVWNWLQNLVLKYGLMPEGVMTGSTSSANSYVLREHLDRFMAVCAEKIRKAYQSGATPDDLYALKDELLGDVYKILSIHLGVPPETFDYRYKDKDDKTHHIEGCTPIKFCREIVRIDPNDFVQLKTFPLEEFPDFQVYEYINAEMGNVPEGQPIRFVKVPYEEARQCLVNSINHDDPAQVGVAMADYDTTEGFMDPRHFDVGKLYGLDFSMSDGDRIRYLAHGTNHQMMAMGYDDPFDTGTPRKWKIQNSWGKDKVGKDGYFIATDDWMRSNALKFVVHKSALTPKVQAALDTPPTYLSEKENPLMADKPAKQKYK